MKNLRKLPVFALFIFLGIQGIFAQQKLRIENVRKAYLRNSGVIYGGKDIKGYFFFYQSDKVSKKEVEYALKLTDQNLNPAKEIKFVDSKDLILQESAYNGKDLVFQFYNNKEGYLEYRIYGTDGELRNSYTRELDKKSKKYYENYLDLNAETQSIFPLGKGGFASVLPLRDDGKYSYEVNFMMTDKKKLVPYTPENEDKFSQPQYIGSTDSVLLIQVLRRTRLLSQDMESWLVGFNVFTGKRIFEMQTIQDFNFYPMNVASIRNSNGNFMLMGPYFKKEDRAVRDHSLGLAVWVLDSRGKVISQKYNSWDKELSKFIPVNERGKVEKIGFVYFHSIQQTISGDIFAVGEGYKKQVSALGMASALAGARTGSIKIRTTDMVLLKFTKDFEISAIKIYNKTNNDISLPQGYETLNAPSLAMVVKATGGFDYEYTQTDEDVSEFVVGYSDYEKSKDFKGLTFNTIHYDGENLAEDKFNLKSNASSMRVLPAKIGSVLVLEYNKKTSSIDAHIEKIN